MIATLRLFVLALSVVAALGAPRAHSILESSVPADGAVVGEANAVSLTFAAPVRLVSLRLLVDGADIALEIDRDASPSQTFAIPLPALTAGRYEIKWSALAADGHDVNGAFSFTIAGEAAAPAASDPKTSEPAVTDFALAKAFVKAALYLATLIAAGGVFFIALFSKELAPAERGRLALLITLAALLALLLTAARVMMAASSLGGAPGEWQYVELVLDGSEGAAASLRAIGLVAIALFAKARGWLFALAVGAAIAAAMSFALTGHSVGVPPGKSAQLAVALHLVALAYWVGALIPLFQMARGEDLARLARVAARFGNIALVAVGVLIAAGLWLIWALLDLPEGLIGSTYGRLLLLKLALVSLLLALAAYNKLRLTPRLQAGDRAAALGLRRSIAAEIALVILIANATAMLTTLTGPPNVP